MRSAIKVGGSVLAVFVAFAASPVRAGGDSDVESRIVWNESSEDLAAWVPASLSETSSIDALPFLESCKERLRRSVSASVSEAGSNAAGARHVPTPDSGGDTQLGDFIFPARDVLVARVKRVEAGLQCGHTSVATRIDVEIEEVFKGAIRRGSQYFFLVSGGIATVQGTTLSSTWEKPAPAPIAGGTVLLAATESGIANSGRLYVWSLFSIEDDAVLHAPYPGLKKTDRVPLETLRAWMTSAKAN